MRLGSWAGGPAPCRETFTLFPRSHVNKETRLAKFPALSRVIKFKSDVEGGGTAGGAGKKGPRGWRRHRKRERQDAYTREHEMAGRKRNGTRRFGTRWKKCNRNGSGWIRAGRDSGRGCSASGEDGDARKTRFYFVNNDNSSANAYTQQRRVAYGLTVNTLPEINGIREWDSRRNPFVPKSPVNTGTIIPRRDS